MSIASQIEFLQNELPSTVKLVAVSKFKPSSDVMEAYNAGQRAFGENRPQELSQKALALPKDIEWHFIGHLQTNKLKMVIPYASMIQSIDSIKLLEAVDRAASSAGRIIDCLIEVHIASEESKQGFSYDEAVNLVSRLKEFRNLRFRGVMGMASFVDDSSQVRGEFHSLKVTFERMRSILTQLDPSVASDFNQISMGMSHDYHIAVDEGATIVRIGTSIFGGRQ